MPQLSGAMQAKRLGFSYTPERSALFQDISFTLNSGDFLAVSGTLRMRKIDPIEVVAWTRHAHPGRGSS